MAVQKVNSEDDHDKGMPSSPSSPPPTRRGHHHRNGGGDDDDDDEPSQMTDDGRTTLDGARTLDSRRSTFSFDNVRSVIHQAGEILVGRLPADATGNANDDPTRPSMIEFDGGVVPSSSNGGGGGGMGGTGTTANTTNRSMMILRETSQEMDPTTERAAVAEGGGEGSRGERPIDFLRDPPEEMTLARRIALTLQHRTWYNPSLLVAQEVDEIERDENFRTAQRSYEAPKGGRLMDAYPFTVSKREKPSLAKAWACKFLFYTFFFPPPPPPFPVQTGEVNINWGSALVGWSGMMLSMYLFIPPSRPPYIRHT